MCSLQVPPRRLLVTKGTAALFRGDLQTDLSEEAAVSVCSSEMFGPVDPGWGADRHPACPPRHSWHLRKYQTNPKGRHPEKYLSRTLPKCPGHERLRNTPKWECAGRPHTHAMGGLDGILLGKGHRLENRRSAEKVCWLVNNTCQGCCPGVRHCTVNIRGTRWRVRGSSLYQFYKFSVNLKSF